MKIGIEKQGLFRFIKHIMIEQIIGLFRFLILTKKIKCYAKE